MDQANGASYRGKGLIVSRVSRSYWPKLKPILKWVKKSQAGSIPPPSKVLVWVGVLWVSVLDLCLFHCFALLSMWELIKTRARVSWGVKSHRILLLAMGLKKEVSGTALPPPVPVPWILGQLRVDFLGWRF